MLIQLVIYLSAFFFIWIGADLVVNSVLRLARKLNLSSFAVSFFVLGILTSMPEFSVGLSSIIDGDPEIFVGNLIGASFILFVLIIPILAIFGNGIKLAHQLTEKNLILALFAVLTPAIFISDGAITRKEGLLMILTYAFLFYFIEKRKGLLEKIHDHLFDGTAEGPIDLGKIVLGSTVVLLSSKILVDKTIYFANIFNFSPFLISLLLLSLGTNLPELSIAAESIFKKHKEVAFGDYLGSAAANTFLFGVLVLLNGSFTIASDNFFATLFLFSFGLVLFYLFARSKKDISRDEGIILLLVYLLFLVIEVVF